MADIRRAMGAGFCIFLFDPGHDRRRGELYLFEYVNGSRVATLVQGLSEQFQERQAAQRKLQETGSCWS